MSAPAELDQAARAALLIMLLDEEQATKILAQLDADELKVLGERMCALQDIDPSMIIKSVSDFFARTEQVSMLPYDRVQQVQTLMTGAVGEVKASHLMRAIAPTQSRKQSCIELTKWLDADTIVTLIDGEHPQLIAVLLIQLEADVAAKVLHSLSNEAQSAVVKRIATLGAVSADAIAMLEDLLERKIAQNGGAIPLQLGGASDAAQIIKQSGKAAEKEIMARIAKENRALAKEIEAEMFRFEHVFELDPQSMGALLREVDSETLVDALKGIGEEQRNYFFRAMSARAADGVRDEIEVRGRLKMADVEAAQKDIVDAARRLAADGTIVFGSGGEDDYV